SLHRDSEALEETNSLIKKNPQNSEYYDLKSDVLYIFKKYEEALEAIDIALKISPNNKEYHLHREFILEHIERYDEALKEYDNVIKIEPNRGFSYYKKAMLLLDLNRYQEALQELNLAITLDPDDAEFHYKKAYILYRLGNYEAATTELPEILKGRFSLFYLVKFAELSALLGKSEYGIAKVNDILSKEKPDTKELCEHLNYEINRVDTEEEKIILKEIIEKYCK
ncbi:hypothetical protein SE19_09185, partial [Acidiplasma aeolicum]